MPNRKFQKSFDFYSCTNVRYLLVFTECWCRCVQISPAREDAVFQACGLTAEPTALVTGSAAAGQRGTRRWEGSDQQAAQGSFRDRGKDKQQKGHMFLKENILK